MYKKEIQFRWVGAPAPATPQFLNSSATSAELKSSKSDRFENLILHPGVDISNVFLY